MYAHAHPWSKTLITVAFVCGLAGCGGENDASLPAPQEQAIQKGWSNNCTLTCTNVSVNQSETVERPGRAGNRTICKVTKEACEAERSAACADAVATTNNETLYDNCELVSDGECVEGCSPPQ